MPDLFPLHTLDSAPDAARPILEKVSASFRSIPNLFGVMASSPALAEAYITLSGIFEKQTSLSAIERQVVLLAVSRFHECRYCMAAHSVGASMQGVPSGVIDAIRNDLPIQDPKLEALRRVSTVLVEGRGHLTESDLQEFLAAGYAPAQLLDVLVGVSQKILSNFTNHITKTPLDEAMSARAWAPSTG